MQISISALECDALAVGSASTELSINELDDVASSNLP